MDGGAAAGNSGGKGKKGGFLASDFSVAYAKSGKSTCVACEENIPKGDVRISKKDFTSEAALRFAGASGMVT